MIKFIILFILILLILAFLIYFSLKTKQQVIQSFTIQDFIQESRNNTDISEQNQSLFDTIFDAINDFFDGDNDNGDSDDGDIGDGGDDGGE